MTPELQTLLTAVQEVHRAFGAPGDYGYEKPEGKALYALYKAASAFPRQAQPNQ
jgi:hypothetical protein